MVRNLQTLRAISPPLQAGERVLCYRDVLTGEEKTPLILKVKLDGYTQMLAVYGVCEKHSTKEERWGSVLGSCKKWYCREVVDKTPIKDYL